MATLLIAVCVKKNIPGLIPLVTVLGFGLDLLLAYGIVRVIR